MPVVRVACLSGIIFALGVTRLVPAAETAEENFRAALEASRAKNHGLAVEKLTQVINERGDLAAAYYHRGREQFCLGEVEAAVKDLDKYVELKPDAASSQWEHGIAYYYAGEFAKGAKQFELYQTFHDQDVENAVWRYLCLAETEGVEKARETLLPITGDRRVPMTEIYDLFRGKLKPADVLAAAERAPATSRHAAEFYAHLYVGLWYIAAKDEALAFKHLTEADKRPIAHYMHDVARVHVQRLREEKQK